MTYWNWGVNFGGSEKSHYSFMLDEKIVVGWQPDTPYEVGDIVAITKGYGLLALARIDRQPQSIISQQKYANVMTDYDISYTADTIFAKATFFKVFPYQKGGCEVANAFHQQSIQLLWDHATKNKKTKG